MIQRIVSKLIANHLYKGKAIILIGARQVGKTTLINELLKNIPEKKLIINGDEADSFFWAIEPTVVKLRALIGDHKIVFIDEAQRIPNIGIIMKLIIDNIADVQVIATGSSAFDLSNRTNEPLTGRKYEFQLFPFSFHELVQHSNLPEEIKMLNQRLIFGNYPEIITKPAEQTKLLSLLAGSYLFKDLLALDFIRKPDLLDKIIRALAFQIGNEVNYLELSQLVGYDKQTVEKYIDLLEKTYVIFKLPAFSRNLRNEIKKGRKIYFYDNGIRNAVIGNFSDIETRTDRGALWENYLISERKKLLSYQDRSSKSYFWRTFQQSEIDYIEEESQRISAYEFKWNSKATWKIAKPFKDSYNPQTIKLIHPQNYYEFLGIE
ncbi:MAG: ATP-binding protein [Candidatus Cloacimonadales bacterium]|nr:ATP-binding protein [Candidatus Cloacimonadales bacterium]